MLCGAARGVPARPASPRRLAVGSRARRMDGHAGAHCLLRLRLSMLLGMFALLHAFAQAGPTHEAAESGDEALLA